MFAKINTDTEQNKGVRAELEQNKRFLRALPAGSISHFTSRIYPSLEGAGRQSRVRVESRRCGFRCSGGGWEARFCVKFK